MSCEPKDYARHDLPNVSHDAFILLWNLGTLGASESASKMLFQEIIERGNSSPYLERLQCCLNRIGNKTQISMEVGMSKKNAPVYLCPLCFFFWLHKQSWKKKQFYSLSEWERGDISFCQRQVNGKRRLIYFFPRFFFFGWTNLFLRCVGEKISILVLFISCVFLRWSILSS